MLTQLLRDNPDVAEALTEAVLGYIDPEVEPPFLAPPRSDHYALVGTAFDYFLRLELQRQNPKAEDREWVATTAVRMMREGRATFNAKFPGALTDDLVDLYERVEAEARSFASTYRNLESLPEGAVETMAKYVLCLAKIDPFFRTLTVDPSVAIYDDRDVADVVRLFEITPWDKLGADRGAKPMLNPSFGKVSEVFRGADADLIIHRPLAEPIVYDATLVDFKTSKNYGIIKHLPQLLGYAAIADEYRRTEDPGFPRLTSAGIYWARHGNLETFGLDRILTSPAFLAARDLLFAKARASFGVPA